MSTCVTQLRRHRRRAGLSQQDLALLIGNRPVNIASRHEHALDESGLRTAVTLEVIFRASLRELFPAIYQKVEKDVVKRANKLLRGHAVDSMSQDKLRTLMAIVDPPFEDLVFEPVARP